MKLIFTLLTLTILVSNVFGQDKAKLYPITKGNLWGYIDESGKPVIKPQFLAAGQFSEGLAPVRLNGTYGYIDKTGTFKIPPKYDLALSFDNGQAKVFIDGKPFFIDKKGNITFQHNFKSISTFENNLYAIAVTQTDKYCLINRKGKLLTDTIFKEINPFQDGVAVVYGLNHVPYPKDSTQVQKFETGVIDSTGKWMIRYGNYKDIDSFKNGYASAIRFNQTEKESSWSREDAIIDKNGKLKFILPVGKYFLDFDNKGFYDDLAVVYIYPEKKDPKESGSAYDKRKHMGVINTDGVILFSDTTWKEITPFRFNRAFVQAKSENWKMINKQGKQVGDSTFKNILFNTYRADPEGIFTNGKAWVKLTGGWVAIDTTGKILTQPKVFSVEDNRLSRVGDIIFLEEDISVESDRYSYRYGFWNAGTNKTVSPAYHDIDMSGFNNDLIYAMKDGRKHYITSTGKVVWKEEKSKDNTSQLNIDFMNRGYYYASSKYKEDLAGFGGWGGSDNRSKAVSPDIQKAGNRLQVIIDPDKKTRWAENYKGMKLFVANTSNDTLYFSAQDSRLYLKLQAQDKNGQWKDIEYLPSSWCGNSYHTLFLAPNELWSFSAPVYHGEFKTKIRAQLLFMKRKGQKKDDIVYSNEIDGYINPGQFWNKRNYYPNGLMDPYND